MRRTLLPVIVGLAIPTPASSQAVAVYADTSDPRVGFALERLESALAGHGRRMELADLSTVVESGGIRIVLAERDAAEIAEVFAAIGGDPTANLEPEGFALRTTATAAPTHWVIGYDDAGVMYGGLELAEQIRLYGVDDIRPMVRNPYMATRGTKFNIPLDARTPSYTDMSDVAQANIATMWDIDFWKAYLDDLALHRYNLVSLWNLHPFPSMVRVPEYPEIALDDVMRSTGPFQENYSTRVVDIAGSEILANLETIEEITIDEKVEFWREVMRYGADRNIDFYIMTWNVYTYGTAGKYGITDSFRDERTIDYFRSSVRAMFDTYPLLKGIGLTTGENFGDNTNSATFREKEDWAFRTYGQGLLDAAEREPDREFVFVHRLHETGVQSDAAAYAASANVAAVDIADWFRPLVDDPDIDFLFSFKYAQAHVYSSTNQQFHTEYVRDIRGMKTLWTLRNDDVYYFRWGAPDFVREFYRNMPTGDVTQGFYYGSDQYVWGREFLSLEPETPREIELDKHWYQWMLWGRLGYDPSVTNERFMALLAERFPEAEPTRLFRAWQEASMIYPLTTGFHWGLYDFHWYIEGSRGRGGGQQSGFHDVERFITLGPHPGTGYLSIPDYVRLRGSDADIDGIAPPEVSAQLLEHSARALALLEGMEHGGNDELRATLTDIETVAYLGRYYGHKIAGATELALFRETTNDRHREEAIRQLREAAVAWRLYAATALGQYRNPLWTNRVGNVDWRRSMAEVLNDIVIAGGDPTVPSIASKSGGTVLEAEEASIFGVEVVPAENGSTGRGYVRTEGAGADGWIEWTYAAPGGGTYLVDLRYAMAEGVHHSAVTVNGEGRPFVLWTTGGEATWAWDRVPVQLRSGDNTIRLEMVPGVRVDHLRIESTN